MSFLWYAAAFCKNSSTLILAYHLILSKQFHIFRLNVIILDGEYTMSCAVFLCVKIQGNFVLSGVYIVHSFPLQLEA